MPDIHEYRQSYENDRRGKQMNNVETLIPAVGVITDVRIDTPDIKTFRVVTTDGKKAFLGRNHIALWDMVV